jgi:hypothetical protein
LLVGLLSCLVALLRWNELYAWQSAGETGLRRTAGNAA